MQKRRRKSKQKAALLNNPSCGLMSYSKVQHRRGGRITIVEEARPSSNGSRGNTGGGTEGTEGTK